MKPRAWFPRQCEVRDVGGQILGDGALAHVVENRNQLIHLR